MDPSVFNVTTALLMAFTIWLVIFRQVGRVDSNWPFLYYACAVAFTETFSGGLDPQFVYGGLICGLLLRFEFLGAFFTKFVRVVEMAVAGYILWRGLALIMLW
jgi:hypothetical protein